MPITAIRLGIMEMRFEYDPPEPRWQERLAALDQYVARLPAGDTERERHRNDLRRQMYDACRAAEIEPPIRSCDAPVGSGKTTAVMAYLLQVAQEKATPAHLRCATVHEHHQAVSRGIP